MDNLNSYCLTTLNKCYQIIWSFWTNDLIFKAMKSQVDADVDLEEALYELQFFDVSVSLTCPDPGILTYM